MKSIFVDFRILKKAVLFSLIAAFVFTFIPIQAFAEYNDRTMSPLRYDWTYIVINNFAVPASEYVVKDENDVTNIFISNDKLKHAIKYPTLYMEGMSPYPKVSVDAGTISYLWEVDKDTPIRVNMMVGSTEVSIMGEVYDMGTAPFEMDGKIFIPIAVFISFFDMKLLEHEDSNQLFIQFEKDFPSEYLVGSWSSIDTDLFTVFEDTPSGLKGLSSFAEGYIYKDDGTYRLRLLSVGGFEDTFIEQTGKYRIIGNTIMHYDIIETVYKGKVLSLKYKDKALESPSYSYIYDYEPNMDGNKIKIDGNWLHLLK